MPIRDQVARVADMHATRALSVYVQNDGDIIVAITDGRFPVCDEAEVEFCSPAGGGGRSHKTRTALFALIEAIKSDNADHPIPE